MTIKTMDLTFSDIRIDGGTQSRSQINTEIVSEYKNAIELGDNFPPIDVFFDGKHYWLADGFHRWHASKSAGLETISATVHQGTNRDAILFAAGANGAHGLQRSNADKRHAVMLLLNDPEWSQWSAREIARRCCVHHSFVADMRQTVSVNDTVSPVKFTTSTGKTATHTAERKNTKPVADQFSSQEPTTTPEPAFVCGCGEAFNSEVWHCDVCGDHWLPNVESCGNCYAGQKPETTGQPSEVDEPQPKPNKKDTKVNDRKPACDISVAIERLEKLIKKPLNLISIIDLRSAVSEVRSSLELKGVI